MRGHRRGGGEGIGAKPVGIGGGSARRSRAGVGMEEEVDEYGVLDGVDAEGEDGELRTEDGAGTEGRAAKRQSGVGGWVKGTRAAISESIGRDWNWSTF